jgi:hypothetical protein
MNAMGYPPSSRRGRDFGGISWNNGVLAPVKCEKKITRGKNIGFSGMIFVFIGLAEIKKIKSGLYPIK